MATMTTLTALPSLIYAGDTLLFSVALSSYKPSDGWTLQYSFRKSGGTNIDIQSTQGSTDDHLFNIPSETTGGWVAGDYSGQMIVNDGTNYRTIGVCRLTINPDLSQQGADYDGRTHSEKCLDAIEAVMEGRSSKDIISTTIAGQSVARLTPEQLVFWRNHYRAEVEAEQAAIDAANGLATGKNILIRFN